MNICVWFKTTDQPWGGGNQFLRALTGALQASGHEVRNEPWPGCDVVLINSHNAGPGMVLSPGQVARLRKTGKAETWSRMTPAVLWTRGKRKGPALVHRLDGVPFLIRGVRSPADSIIPRLNRLTDFTIFQSAYSRDSFKSVGVNPQHQTIILNGVNPETFRPSSGTTENKEVIRLMASSWSSNPRKGFARIARLSEVPDVEVQFAGNWPPNIPSAKVHMLGALPSPALADALRSSDAMIHAAENEPCSNAILEALACGLPVLYLDSGGNRELAGDFGLPLSDNPASDVESLRKVLPELQNQVIKSREIFLVNKAANSYMEVFKTAIRLASPERTNDAG